MSALSSEAKPTPPAVPHGYEEDERSRVLRVRPPAPALAWVEAAVGGSVTGIRALKGGSSSAMHVLRIRTGPGAHRAVLRRYVLPRVIAEEPDIVEREANALELLDLWLPAARVLAVDPTGAEAGGAGPSDVISPRAGGVGTERD
jgi:hypothetical protein